MTKNIQTNAQTRKFNHLVEQFDKLTDFRLDRSDPWAIVLECERQAERAIDTQRAAGWYRLALAIKDAERAINPRRLEDVAPVTAEMAD